MNHKVIITKLNNQLFFLFLVNDELFHIYAYREVENDLNKIFLGKIKNIQKNLCAAFVEYQPNKLGFLQTSLDKFKTLKQEQDILVQVTKNASALKEVTLSNKITMNGLFCTINYEPGGLFVSKKIPSFLKSILLENLENVSEKQYTIILRTNVLSYYENHPNEDINILINLIKDEMSMLYKKLDTCILEATHRTTFGYMLNPDEFPMNMLQKCYKIGINEVIVDQIDIYDKLQIEYNSHELLPIRFYNDSFPLAALYSLNSKLENCLNRKVHLKSGGFLIIEPTEALTVIDVNSGKNTKNLSKDALIEQTNLEAIYESARQIMARNISGIIIIDFIKFNNIKKLYPYITKMKEALAIDVVKSSVVDITNLGLMEITRQKNDVVLKEQMRK